MTNKNKRKNFEINVTLEELRTLPFGCRFAFMQKLAEQKERAKILFLRRRKEKLNE